MMDLLIEGYYGAERQPIILRSLAIRVDRTDIVRAGDRQRKGEAPNYAS